VVQDSQGNVLPFNINMVKAKALVDGLQNKLHDRPWHRRARVVRPRVTGHVTQPPGLPAKEMIACANALVHSGRGRVYAHTPRFFNQVAVPYPFDAAATTPRGLARLPERPLAG
jgi:hypothetical protein